MSAEVTLSIRCDVVAADGERCDTEWGWPVRVAHHRELRRLLRGQGWTWRRRTGDICPNHGLAVFGGSALIGLAVGMVMRDR